MSNEVQGLWSQLRGVILPQGSIHPSIDFSTSIWSQIPQPTLNQEFVAGHLGKDHRYLGPTVQYWSPGPCLQPLAASFHHASFTTNGKRLANSRPPLSSLRLTVHQKDLSLRKRQKSGPPRIERIFCPLSHERRLQRGPKMPPDDKPPHEVLELVSLSLRHDVSSPADFDFSDTSFICQLY